MVEEEDHCVLWVVISYLSIYKMLRLLQDKSINRIEMKDYETTNLQSLNYLNLEMNYSKFV